MPYSEVPVAASNRFRNHVYVGGEWRPAATDNRIEIIDCYTEEALGHAPCAEPAEVDQAVNAASMALDGWSRTPLVERADAIERILDQLNQRVEIIASLWAREAGMPITTGRAATMALPVATLRHYSELLRSSTFIEQIGNTSVVREPVGVVAAITPWNYPFSQILIKTISALAAGCTVVAKPSEVAPLCAYEFAEMVEEADLPPGVFNLVPGDGSGTGEVLVRHRGVSAISFTGSTDVGKLILASASSDLKRVTLELGGKSAALITEDGDLEEAVAATMASCLRNNGQTCTALTRLLVPERMVEEAEALAVVASEGQLLGDPLDSGTTIGPLVSSEQRRRVVEFIESGVDEGAHVLVGGADPPAGFDRGYFVAPTVFGAVRPEMTIAREEIFGPVQSVVSYRTIDEAIEIANSTRYGLAASVWSGSHDRAMEIAMRLGAGTVTVNGGPFNAQAPYGGMRQSGIGRELGRWGIEEFLELKSIHQPLV